MLVQPAVWMFCKPINNIDKVKFASPALWQPSWQIAQLSAAESALALAKLTLKRDAAQFKIQAISQAQLDMDEADVKAKQALVAQRRAVLGKLQIRAPFSGRIGVSMLSVGQLLNVGERIASLQNTKQMLIDFNIPQKQLAAVSKGQVVHLRSNSYAEHSFDGKVSAVDTVVNATTRNVLVEAVVDNQDDMLKPGMFAQVVIQVGASKRWLTLPQTAITYNAYGATLFLAKAGAVAEDGQAGLPVADLSKQARRAVIRWPLLVAWLMVQMW